MPLHKELPQRSFRLQPEENAKLSAALGIRKKEVQDVLHQLAMKWVEDPNILNMYPPLQLSPPPQELREMIIGYLLKYLEKSADWLPSSAELDLQLYREGHSVFGTRIDHFREEKKALARQFTSWLLRRIQKHLDADQKNGVYLCIDSGSGLYWVFRELGEGIIKAVKKSDLSRLTIVTNNLAGTECYSTLSRQQKHFQPKGGLANTELSEYVKCKLLGGDLLPRYSALTGKITINDLKGIKFEAGKRARFIGLVVGQWVWMKKTSPVPLARGSGQVDFKKALVETCNEVFLLAPLGKLLRAKVEVINQKLRTTGSVQGGGYQAAYEEDMNHVRLVTTCRSGGHWLGHSNSIRSLYGLEPDENSEPRDDAPISELPLIQYPYEHPGKINIETEIKLEAPHPYEWSKDVLSTLFSVALEDWTVLDRMRAEYRDSEE